MQIHTNGPGINLLGYFQTRYLKPFSLMTTEKIEQTKSVT